MQYSCFNIHIIKIHIVKKLMLNHFNVKLYYFCILPKALKLLHTTAQAQYFTKIQVQIIFSQTQLTQQHKAWLFSLQLLTYCSTIGSVFLTFLTVIGAIHPIHSTKCLNNWFEVLSTCVTLIQSLVSQLIGTNKQSIKSS